MSTSLPCANFHRCGFKHFRDIWAIGKRSERNIIPLFGSLDLWNIFALCVLKFLRGHYDCLVLHCMQVHKIMNNCMIRLDCLLNMMICDFDAVDCSNDSMYLHIVNDKDATSSKVSQES